MDQRRIPAYDGYPSKEHLEALHPNLVHAEDAFKTEYREDSPQKKTAPRPKKKRSHQKSISEDFPKQRISESLDSDEKTPVQLSTPPQSPRSPDQVRSFVCRFLCVNSREKPFPFSLLPRQSCSRKLCQQFKFDLH
jgi:hypothetical protein